MPPGFRRLGQKLRCIGAFTHRKPTGYKWAKPRKDSLLAGTHSKPPESCRSLQLKRLLSESSVCRIIAFWAIFWCFGLLCYLLLCRASAYGVGLSFPCVCHYTLISHSTTPSSVIVYGTGKEFVLPSRCVFTSILDLSLIS